MTDTPQDSTHILTDRERITLVNYASRAALFDAGCAYVRALVPLVAERLRATDDGNVVGVDATGAPSYRGGRVMRPADVVAALKDDADLAHLFRNE